MSEMCLSELRLGLVASTEKRQVVAQRQLEAKNGNKWSSAFIDERIYCPSVWLGERRGFWAVKGLKRGLVLRVSQKEKKQQRRVEDETSKVAGKGA